jgi:ABC-type glycerol-3-phosphate transport system substrate-binding protein
MGAAALLLGLAGCTGGTGVDTVGATDGGPVKEVSWNDIDQRTSTMVRNGNPPDIFDAFVRSGTVNGHMYGFPDLSSVRALFYNKDLFDRAGIANPPTTWTSSSPTRRRSTANTC